MGRQIRYYATKKDLVEIIDFIKSIGGIIVEKNGNEIDDNVKNKMTEKVLGLYIKTLDSQIGFCNYSDGSGAFLVSAESETVEFMPPFPCTYDPELKNAFHYGRFYVETDKYYNSEICKMLYDRIVKYIKKNYLISDDKDAYIADEAYELYENGKYVPINFSGKFVKKTDGK